jgi:hypothetical protein
LFQNRVGFSVSTYLNRNSQQLLRTPLPAVTGFYEVYENRPAEVENKGLEVVLDGTPVNSRNFVWSVTANASFQRNKLVRLDGIDDYYINGSRLAVGKPISSYRAYKYGGVDPQTGSYFFIDRKGNPSTQLTMRTEPSMSTWHHDRMVESPTALVINSCHLIFIVCLWCVTVMQLTAIRLI